MPTTSAWKARIAKLWSYSQKVAAGRLPFALFTCGLLAYGAAFAWRMLANFDLVNLIGPVNYDDAFYYFQIAYNLSQGKFSTFDGITQTNGYHPVWMLLITPFYWLFDKDTALFGIKAFEIALVAGGAAVIAAAARLARLAWPLLFAALPTLYRYPNQLLLGLEAAAAMFALALLILAVCLYMRDPNRWKWRLAALAFTLPWVRIEYISISLAATAALCAIEWSRKERRALSLSSLVNIRRAYIPLIGAVAGILVYFAYNRLIFGGMLPVSAAMRLAWSQARVAQEGGYDFMRSFRETLMNGVFDYELLIAFEICAYLLIVWLLALRSDERRDWLLVAFLVGVFGLAAGHISKFAQIVLIMPYYGSKVWHFVPGVPNGGAHNSRKAVHRNLSHTPLHRPATAHSRQCVERRRRYCRRGGSVCKGGLRSPVQMGGSGERIKPNRRGRGFLHGRADYEPRASGRQRNRVVGRRRRRLLLTLSRSESGRTGELL